MEQQGPLQELSIPMWVQVGTGQTPRCPRSTGTDRKARVKLPPSTKGPEQGALPGQRQLTTPPSSACRGGEPPPNGARRAGPRLLLGWHLAAALPGGRSQLRPAAKLTHGPQDSCHPSTRAPRLSSPFQALPLSLFFFPTAQSVVRNPQTENTERGGARLCSGSLRGGKASGHTMGGGCGPHMPHAGARTC